MTSAGAATLPASPLPALPYFTRRAPPLLVPSPAGLVEVLRGATYVGLADDTRALVQSGTRLYLADLRSLGGDLMYQQARRGGVAGAGQGQGGRPGRRRLPCLGAALRQAKGVLGWRAQCAGLPGPLTATGPLGGDAAGLRLPIAAGGAARASGVPRPPSTQGGI